MFRVCCVKNIYFFVTQSHKIHYFLLFLLYILSIFLKIYFKYDSAGSPAFRKIVGYPSRFRHHFNLQSVKNLKPTLAPGTTVVLQLKDYFFSFPWSNDSLVGDQKTMVFFKGKTFLRAIII